MQIHPLSGSWQFRQIGADEWLPATVPGGVHTDLLALGRIPDPFVADNEKRVQWVAESDWEYRRTFTAGAALLAEEHVFLVCDGLDTLAEVTLNGQRLSKTDNMFRQYRWEVKSLLVAGENEIAVAFASPVNTIAPLQASRNLAGVSQAIPGGPHIRKAPCQFGWDWGPQLPPVGIWKDIRLEGRSAARLADVHLRQNHAGDQVEVEAEVEIERWSDAPLVATLRITAPDGTVIEKTTVIASDLCEAIPFEVAETSKVSLRADIPNPQLWWPNGYGDQPLYEVKVEVKAKIKAEVKAEITPSASASTSTSTSTLDSASYTIGLRTIELRQQPDEWGRSFEFVVNGVRIWAKGANWIPADSFPTRISDAYLEGLIRSAAESHQNMLRVWGGGLYEEERFYDLCDRYGILVWQEFIFSCSVYPLDDPAFVENVHVEAVQNMRRLRHRASLALWCGNNEMEWGWESWGWARPDYADELIALADKVPALQSIVQMMAKRQPPADWRQLRDAYDAFFHHTLPAWVAAEDPDHAYWPSSPSSDTPFSDVNGQRQGDAHYWDVWHGRKPFTAYRDQFPRFMSEFGFQSLPPLPTVRTYAEPADWNMTSYVMEHHQRNASGNGLMIGQMTDTFQMPKDFPALVYLSMLLQAEGIRYGVEHWRRHPDRVAGTLYWQLNDCWPVASWASLDYFGRWKALHYAARRFYAPVLLSVEDKGTEMGVYVTNDTTTAWAGTVRWSLETLSGQLLETGKESVAVAAQACAHVCTRDFAARVADDSMWGFGRSPDRQPAGPDGVNARQLIFVAELWQGDKLIAHNLGAFVPNKHLALVDPGLAGTVRRAGATLAFDVTATSLARFVELSLDGADVVFSDNYFDVVSGRPVTVTCPLPAGWNLRRVRKALCVRSLYDSFA